MAKKLTKKQSPKPAAKKRAPAAKKGGPGRKKAGAGPSKASRPSKPSKPSRPSGPSKPSGQSRPSKPIAGKRPVAARGSRPAGKSAPASASKGGKLPAKKFVKKVTHRSARESATGKLRSEMRAAGLAKQPAVNAGASGPLTARQAHRKRMMEEARAFAIEAARLLADDRCEDIVILEIASASQMSDYIVIGSGTSDRQMRGVGDDVAKLGKEMGFTSSRRNVDDRTTWLLIDFAGVIVHLFEPNARAFYDLEMMWGDAPRIEWARPAGSRPPIRRAAAAEVEQSEPEAMDDAAEDQAAEATDIQ